MKAARWVGGVAALCVLGSCGSMRVNRSYGIGEQVVLGIEAEPTIDGEEEEPSDLPLYFNLIAETGPIYTGPAQHVYVTGFRLAVTDTDRPEGDEDDLGFVDRIEVYLESSAEGSTLERILVAHLDEIEDGAQSISLEVDDEDVLPYLHEGIRLQAIATGLTPMDDVSYTGHFDVVILL